MITKWLRGSCVVGEVAQDDDDDNDATLTESCRIVNARVARGTLTLKAPLKSVLSENVLVSIFVLCCVVFFFSVSHQYISFVAVF